MGWTIVAVIALALAALQAIASLTLRGLAQPGAWVSFVPTAAVAWLDRIDPHVPLPPALRLVMARSALAAHDVARARADVAQLRPSPDRFALEGGIAEALGDSAVAMAAYLAAGDLNAVERRVEILAQEQHVGDALALQHLIIARLGADRTQADALAEAYFRLGLLEQRQAYALGAGSARRVHERQALTAYESAVKLLPLAERYLIAAGNQQLNLHEVDAAVRSFERAHDADPTSADPLVGLGDAAARRGDAAGARAYLDRARAIAPMSEAVGRLAHQIGS